MNWKLTTILCCLLWLANTELVFAQGFERLYRSPGRSSKGNAIVRSPDGGYLLAGTIDTGFTLRSARLIKIDVDGVVQWENTLGNLPGANRRATAAWAADNGTFYVAGRCNNPNKVFFAHLNGGGQVLWQHLYNDSDNLASLFSMVHIVPVSQGGTADPANGFYLVWDDDQTGAIRVVRTDADGNPVWQNQYSQMAFGANRHFVARTLPNDQLEITGHDATPSVFMHRIKPDGVYAGVSGFPATQPPGADMTGLKWLSDGTLLGAYWQALPNIRFTVSKYQPDGTILWSTNILEDNATFWGWDTAIEEMSDGDFLIGFNYGTAQIQGAFAIPTVRMSADGVKKWSKFYVPPPEGFNYYCYDYVARPDGGFAAVGARLVVEVPGDSISCYFISASADGRSRLGLIHGDIAKDLDLNCTNTPQEAPITGIPVLAVNGANQVFSGLTDANGHYTIEVDTGVYAVSMAPPGSFWAPCQSQVPVIITPANDTVVVDFNVQASADCPLLDVQMSTDRLRPCLTSSWTLDYCNSGTQTATDAFVILTLDSLLSFSTADVPFTILSDFVIRLELGDVTDLECGQVHFTTLTSCAAQIGQNLCSEAHIYPDSSCSGNNNAAFLTVSGRCIGEGAAEFIVRNIGDSATEVPAGFIVIEDDMIQYNSSGQVPLLAPGANYPILVSGMGTTFRLELEQAPGNPEWSNPTATVEGCGSNPVWGFSAMLPNDDNGPAIDEACLTVVNSYDPNDKAAYPTGFTTQHYLEKNTDLEYTIRFQNTGTDVAYDVIIRDTLDARLDVAGIRLGVTSHPCTWELMGAGVLKVTFANINLPDSNSNEAASHGFIHFRIPQQKDLPDGTVLRNRAGIYFDANAPIITNTVWHTIGLPFVTATVDGGAGASPMATIAPNPFRESALLLLHQAPPGTKTLSLFDATGRLLQQASFDGDQYRLQAAQLPAGSCFFQVQGANGYRVTGKLRSTNY